MKIRFIFLVIICFLQSVPLKAQQPVTESPGRIFNRIEEGISFREIEKFSRFFGAQTYLSLTNGNPGYYSPNQVFYILQDYFRIFKPVNFRFITMSDNTDTPYASGYYKYESKGIRGTARIYISLKLTGNNWIISQITIN
ncbi:MAG: DUF4783 domain-containing protein [Ignavibacteria bacterium]